jgi:rRNA maturation RNase YbeY
MPSVRFNYADVRPVGLKKKGFIKGFIAEIFVSEGKELHYMDYIFCSDNYLLDINRSFLNHDFFTDIISFDLSESNGIIGEIYISIDRVRENALLHSATFENELLRVIFHGALHLCGYQDKKKSEITIMREKEDYYLRLLKEKNY